MDKVKVLYKETNNEIIAKLNGDLVELSQRLDGDVIATITLYDDEVKELHDFVVKEGQDGEKNEPSGFDFNQFKTLIKFKF